MGASNEKSASDSDEESFIAVTEKPSLSNCKDLENTASTKTIEMPQLRESDEEFIRTGLNNKETYVAHAGMGSVSHGRMYQIKHLMLVLIRAREMGYSFRLATEMPAAEKFNDLVLQYQDNNGDKVHRFVQLEHSRDETRLIKACDLLEDNYSGFSVTEYFISWRKIKKHAASSETILKDFILCTNMGLDIEGLEKDNIGVRNISKPDDFLEVKGKKKQPPRYKLIVEKYSKLHDQLKVASDIHQLAQVLAQRVRNSQKIDHRTDIFKRYHVALAKEVIDIEKKRFSNNFMKNNNLSTTAKRFRKLFSTQLLSDEHVSENDVQKRLEKCELKLSDTFGKNPQRANKSDMELVTELPNDHIDGDEISEFFNVFIIAVDQPNEVELGEMIKRELGDNSMFNLLDANLVGDSFQNDILNWFTNKAGVFLTEKDVQAFFKVIEVKLSSIMTMGLNLDYLGMLKRYDISFERQNRDLLNFLDSSRSTRKPILQLISSQKSLVTALWVYQTLKQITKYNKTDSFIFMRLKKLLPPETTETVLRAYGNSSNNNLLVIDCESIGATADTDRLWNKLNDTIANNAEKRIILIVQGNNYSAVRFQIFCKISHEEDDDISIDNLKKYSKQKLLEKKFVKFQGQAERTSFGRLLVIRDCDDGGVERFTELSRIIDVETLVKLIRGEEIRIGSEMRGLGEIEDYYIPRTIIRHSTGDIEHKILDEKEFLEQNVQGKIVVLSDVAGMGKSTVLTDLARKLKEKEPTLLVIIIDLNQKTHELAEEQRERSFDNHDTKGAVDFLVDKLSSITNDLESQLFKTLIKDRRNAALLFDGFDDISLSYADIVIDLLQTLAKLRLKKLFITTRPHAYKKLKDQAETGRFSLAFYTLRPFSDANQTKFLYKFWKRRLSLNEIDVMTEERLKIHAQNVIDLLTTSINHQMKEFIGVPLQTRLVAEYFQYPLELPKQINVIGLYRDFVKKKYDIYRTKKKDVDSTKQREISDLTVNHLIFTMMHQKFALEALFGEEVKMLLSSQPKVENCLDLFQSVIEDGERTGIITEVIEGKPNFIHRTFAEYFSAQFLFKTLMDYSRNQQVREFFLQKLFVHPAYMTIRCFLNCLLRDVSNAPEKEPWGLRLRESFDDSLGQAVYHIAAEERNLRSTSFFQNRRCPTLRNTMGLDYQFINQSTLPVKIENEGSGSVEINKKIPQINEKLEQEADIKIQNAPEKEPRRLRLRENCNDSLGQTVYHIAAEERNLRSTSFFQNRRCPTLRNTMGLDYQFINQSTLPVKIENEGSGSVETSKKLPQIYEKLEQQADIKIQNAPEKEPWGLRLRENCNDSLDQTVYHIAAEERNLRSTSFFQNRRCPTLRNTMGLDYQFINQSTLPVKIENVGSGSVEINKKIPQINEKLEQEAGINIQNRCGETPLHVAAKQRDNLDVGKNLLKKRAKQRRRLAECSGMELAN